MACKGLCTTKGLTVLPVRYAVLPANIGSGLPGWADDAHITGVKLTNAEKYTLRVLRQGYLYVFYEKGKQGEKYWQCYSVAPDGSLWLQQVASNPASVDKALCETGEHIAQNVEFMSIETPDKCGNVWFAFSQYPWEQETLDRYKTDTKARSARMQKVMPSVTGAQRAETGTDATESDLNQVLDYQATPVSGLLPGPDDVKVQNVSRVTSLWDPSVEDVWRVNDEIVQSQSSLYPWAKNRSGMAGATVAAMKNRSEGMTPLILPLWDPVGIVHELNGWSQDVLGRQAQFLQERELELSTKANLDALKTLLSSKAQARGEAMLERFAQSENTMLSDTFLDARLQTLEQRYQRKPDVLAQIRADDKLVRSWHAQNVTASYPENVLMSSPEPLAAHQRRVAAIKAEVDKELAERPQNFTDARARSWAPYQARLNATRQANFDTCYQSLGDRVNELFQKRIASVVNWLSASLLVTTLDDFHCVAQRAGLFYQSAVGMAINGINSCPAGAAKLDNWWREYSTNSRSNLLWRHVTANNPDLMSELEPLLVTVKARKDDDITPLTATAVTATLMQQAGNLKKLEGYYKKSLDNVVKGLRENASKLETEIFKTDAFIVTVGDRVTRILRVDKLGETLSTTAFRLVFMVRAGIPSEKVHALVNEYLHDAPALRSTVLAGIRSSKRFMASQSEVTTIKQTLSSKLEAHFATEKGRGEYRLAGINSLLLVLNAVDFFYLCSQVRDDKKPLASLMASGLAMVSQVTSVFLPAMEKGLEAQPLTVAWIKGAGAATGGAASLFSVYADGASVYEELENNRFFLSTVLFIKTIIDGLGTFKSLGLLLEALGKPLAKDGADLIARGLAVEILGIRVLAVLMTWEAMVAITLLQVIVTWISDDELQLWCKKSVFGTVPLNRALNGGPWTRELPPPPVLPPYGPLEKISGRIESFSYERFREYFDVKAYRTSTLPEVSDGQRGAAAAVAIAAGSPGIGAVIMAETDSANSSAEYIQGVINGKPFRGWVGVTRVKVGDTVEMAVEWQYDHYEVYAVVIPDERIISMCPECDMGHIAHAMWRIKNMFILTGVILSLVAIMSVIHSSFVVGWGNIDFWKEYSLPFLMMLGVSLFITGLLAVFAYKACAPTRCKLTEEILQLFGMKNAGKVNLKIATKKKELELKEKGLWYEPMDQSKPPRPTRKLGCLFESWFYY